MWGGEPGFEGWHDFFVFELFVGGGTEAYLGDDGVATFWINGRELEFRAPGCETVQSNDPLFGVVVPMFKGDIS